MKKTPGSSASAPHQKFRSPAAGILRRWWCAGGSLAKRDRLVKYYRLHLEALEDRAVPAAAIGTDLPAYHPGDAATINTSGFARGRDGPLPNHQSGRRSEFMKEIAAGQQKGLSYGQALQHARQHVRNNPRWAAPFYWAPFVLIGPAD